MFVENFIITLKKHVYLYLILHRHYTKYNKHIQRTTPKYLCYNIYWLLLDASFQPKSRDTPLCWISVTWQETPPPWLSSGALTPDSLKVRWLSNQWRFPLLTTLCFDPSKPIEVKGTTQYIPWICYWVEISTFNASLPLTTLLFKNCYLKLNSRLHSKPLFLTHEDLELAMMERVLNWCIATC